METRQNDPKVAVLGQNHPVNGKNFRNSSTEDTINVFLAEFHADLSRYREMRVHCTATKNPLFRPQFLTPLAQASEISVRPTCV